MHLLTRNNTKTNKSVKFGYFTFVLHLAPSKLSGHNVCPDASKGCIAGCLNTAGHGGMFKNIADSRVQQARIARTKFFFADRDSFMKQLVHEIRVGIRYANKKGLIPAFRLNGTSDLPWSNYIAEDNKNLFELFPDVQFYDYTKSRVRSDYPNYHLTFSMSESNEFACHTLQQTSNVNVAVVFRKELPAEYNGLPVINGDIHDLRFLDPVKCIVGLRAKGKAKKDTSGFVKDVVAHN